MAVSPTYPGVYIDEVSSGVRPIESASTSTACFIGQTAIDAFTGEPKLIFRLAEYKEFFGFPATTTVKNKVPTPEVTVEVSKESVIVTINGADTASTINAIVDEMIRKVTFKITAGWFV